MIDAIGGLETAIFYRPVEAAAAVGPDSTAQKREAGVVDSEGRAVSWEDERSELALSQEKRALLAQLRGERDALEQDLLYASGAIEEAWREVGIDAGASVPPGELGLSDEQSAAVEELKARDREVRAHEQAHAAVGGQFAGSPTYEYQTGPDGQRYAIGGEVRIDASPVPGDPEATVEKMRQVERAALAPAEPSPQDRAVAQEARAQAQAAQAEATSQSAAVRAGLPEEAAQPAQLIQQAAAGYAANRAAIAPNTASQIRLAA